MSKENNSRMLNAIIGDCSKVILNMDENKSTPKDYHDLYFYWRGMFGLAEVVYEFNKNQRKEFENLLDKLVYKKIKMFGFFGKEQEVFKGDM